jgi:SAM-dependent methyltransferase
MPTNFDSAPLNARENDGDPYFEGTAAMLRLLHMVNATTVADIGCGDAGITKAIAGALPTRATVFAVDVDPTAIEQLSVSTAPLARMVGLTRDVYSLALPKQVDVALSRFLLLDLDNPARAVGAMCRCVRPNGYIVLAEPITSTGRIGSDLITSSADEIVWPDIGLELGALLLAAGAENLTLQAITPVGLGNSTVGHYLGAMTGVDPEPTTFISLPTLVIASGQIP